MAKLEKKMCLKPIHSKNGIICWDFVPVDSLKPVYGDLYLNKDDNEVWMFNGKRWVRTQVYI
jgi:hypothetical protein